MITLTKKWMAILIALVVSGSLSAQTTNNSPRPKQNREFVTILEEDFSLFTAGSEEEPDTNNLALDVNNENYLINPDYTHMPGWTGPYVYQAGGAAFVVVDLFTAYINTPKMEMCGNIHVSFRARINSDSGSESASVTLSRVYDYFSFEMSSEWQTYEFDFYNDESGNDFFILIDCFMDWFLDDLVITSELDFVPTPTLLGVTNYTMEGFDASWVEVSVAEDYLLTVCKYDFYGPEEVVAEPESFENINHDGTWIDYTNPNFPEGWTINLEPGDNRQVMTDAYSGNVAICMDAEGDTVILPRNGGRFLSSNLGLRLVEYTGTFTYLEVIGSVNGTWEYTGTVLMASGVIDNHGNGWFAHNLLTSSILGKYDLIGLVYRGSGGALWAIDDWGYTTSQACNVSTVIEDLEIAAPCSSYTITGLDPAYDYYCFIKAHNTELGESEMSKSVDCLGLSAPIMAEASDIHNDCYTANWQAHPKADAYEVHNYAVYTAETNVPEALVLSELFFVNNGMAPENYVYDLDPMEHRLDEYTEFKDWIGQNVILANSMVGAEMGELYEDGYIITPELKLDNADTYRVNATVWSYEGEFIIVTALTTGEEHRFECTESGLQSFEMVFTAGNQSGRERLKFTDKYGDPFLIDNLQVTQDLQAGDQYYGMLSWSRIEDPTVESFTFTNLENYGWEHYAYDVMGIHKVFGREFRSINSDKKLVEVPTEVAAFESQEVSIYPNPTHDNITINAEEMRHITVLSILGQVVYETEVNGDEIVLNLSQFDAGIYLLRVITDNGIITKEVSVMKY